VKLCWGGSFIKSANDFGNAFAGVVTGGDFIKTAFAFPALHFATGRSRNLGGGFINLTRRRLLGR